MKIKRTKLNSNSKVEISFKLESIVICITTVFAFYLYLQLICEASQENIRKFIDLFVQVNITAALAIAALVASIGTFRWEHYISALKHEGMNGEIRRSYIKENAKKPLYWILLLNSSLIVVSVITLLSSNPSLTSMCLLFISFSWLEVSKVLIGVNLALLLVLIYKSLRYMKELLFR
ncbi:hypothetical protein [Paenibacillus sp. KN14-4R]|uniref:hypothetical protein n=1 Tax=Paenibacillus sp. KN14-4R TaxID=3445773 RepID=UPI003F9FF7DB